MVKTTHAKEQRPLIKMCWQQRLLATVIIFLSGGSAITGVKNHFYSETNRKSIEEMRVNSDEKVQKISEQCVELKTDILNLKRDVDRIEKNGVRMDSKLDRLIERRP